MELNKSHQTDEVETQTHPSQHDTQEAGSVHVIEHTTTSEHLATNDHGLTDEQIAAKAFDCWNERGCPHGSADVDWNEAIKRLQSEQKKTTAASA